MADYDNGIIYNTSLLGRAAPSLSGLQHPLGLAFNSAGNLFVADNSPSPSVGTSQGHIYEYKPNGSRAIFAVLDPADRPADLAFDGRGNLFMADLGGKVYKYDTSWSSTSEPSNNVWLGTDQRTKPGV